MTEREDIAQAMAFFEATDDIVLLHQALGDVAPRAKKMVSQLLGRGTEEAIPLRRICVPRASPHRKSRPCGR